jgi:hypothetical protein
MGRVEAVTLLRHHLSGLPGSEHVLTHTVLSVNVNFLPTGLFGKVRHGFCCMHIGCTDPWLAYHVEVQNCR